jgi:hypothetical protein
MDVQRRPAAGAVRFSTSMRLPPVLAAVALNVIVSATIQIRSPSPAATS